MENETPRITKHAAAEISTKQLEKFYAVGFVVMEELLDEAELKEAGKRLDDVYLLQEKEAEKNKYKLEDIKEQDVARMPFAYDPWFLKLVTHSYILDCVEKILGNYFILHLQNGIFNRSNEKHHQDHWHRDIPHQDFIISKPLAVNALICVDEFSEKSGATIVIPASHKMEKFPSAESILQQQIIAPAGAVILMDSMLYHRAGSNSSPATRRAINQMYVAPVLKQQINIPVMLKGKYADDPLLYKVLGYDSAETTSVNEFRLRRLKKIKR